jgi:hypothetical protein
MLLTNQNYLREDFLINLSAFLLSAIFI